MKRVFVLLLLWFNFTTSFAQNEVHKKVADSFMLNYNNNTIEMIFNSFSIKLQKSRPKNYFLDLFNRVRKDFGKLLFVEIIDYQENNQRESRGNYNGHFERGNLQIKLTIDQKGEIIGLYLLKNKIVL